MTDMWPETDPAKETLWFAKPWIGKRCRVYLDDSPDAAPDSIVVGTLVRADAYGEAVIETDEGRVHVWPVLRIEEP